MNRATMSKEGRKDIVLVDDVIIGQGCGCKVCYKSCVSLMDELNASNEKCDIVKEMFIK